MFQFSVITPTYNRAALLPRVYDCLCRQEDADFEWIIVDDGSTDNTKEVVSGFNKKFSIKYIYQENAGQVSAWNTGVKNADSLIIIKNDDDDYLLPNILKLSWNYYDSKLNRFEQNCVSLCGLCQYENGNIMGDRFPKDNYASDHIRFIRNNNIKGDKCYFYITEIFKQYPFPILKNEKNVAPGIVDARIALKYNTFYVNEIFQVKEFLEGGLSTINYWIKYPLGAELYHNEASIPPASLKLQIKHSGEYIYYAKINRKKGILKEANNKKIFFLGIFAFNMLVLKYFLKKFSILKKIKNKINKKNWKVIKSE